MGQLKKKKNPKSHIKCIFEHFTAFHQHSLLQKAEHHHCHPHISAALTSAVFPALHTFLSPLSFPVSTCSTESSSVHRKCPST